MLFKAGLFKTILISSLVVASTAAEAQFIEAPTSLMDFSHTFEIPAACLQKAPPKSAGCMQTRPAYTISCSENMHVFNSETYNKCILQNLQRVHAQFTHAGGIIPRLVESTNFMIERQMELESRVLSQVSLTVKQQLKAELLEILRAEMSSKGEIK